MCQQNNETQRIDANISKNIIDALSVANMAIKTLIEQDLQGFNSIPLHLKTPTHKLNLEYINNHRTLSKEGLVFANQFISDVTDLLQNKEYAFSKLCAITKCLLQLTDNYEIAQTIKEHLMHIDRDINEHYMLNN